jgi:uridine kinase
VVAVPANLVEASTLVSEQVLELVDSGVATPIILIDGRAGSGKSTLAALLQNQLFKDGETLPRLIHMDDLYEGWDGLQAGVDYLQRSILSPVVSRRKASWQEYDWALSERGRWREFEGGTPLIVEGCGSISRNAAEAAQIKCWVESPDSVRYQRWLEREGNDEFFGKWAAQEVEFYARERSTELADLTVAN